MKIKIGDTAVAELLGAVILLAMAVLVFSVVYINVLSDEGPGEKMYTTIIGQLDVLGDESYLIFENEKGESLSSEDIVNVRIAGIDQPITTIGKLTGSDELWNIGEQFKYKVEMKLDGKKNENIPFAEVYTNIVNEETNSMVFYGTLREGYSVTVGSLPFPFHFNPVLPKSEGWDYEATVTPLYEYNGFDIDSSSVHLCNINNVPVYILPEETPNMFQQKMMVKFDRDDIEKYTIPGLNLIAIKGELFDGTIFEYFDIVTVH